MNPRQSIENQGMGLEGGRYGDQDFARQFPQRTHGSGLNFRIGVAAEKKQERPQVIGVERNFPARRPHFFFFRSFRPDIDSGCRRYLQGHLLGHINLI